MRHFVLPATFVLFAFAASGCAPSFDAEKFHKEHKENFEREWNGEPPVFHQPHLSAWRADFIADKQRLDADPEAFFASTSSTTCQVPDEITKSTTEFLDKLQETFAASKMKVEFFDVTRVMLEGQCPDGVLEGDARWYFSYRTKVFHERSAVYSADTNVSISEGTFEGGRLVSTRRKHSRRENLASAEKDPNSPKLTTPTGDYTYDFVYSKSHLDNPNVSESLHFSFTDGTGQSYAFLITSHSRALSGGGSMGTQWKADRKLQDYQHDAQGNRHGTQTKYTYETGLPTPGEVTCYEHGKVVSNSPCPMN